MASKPNTPNDDRSNVKNPNNPAHESDRINREKQGHAPPPAQQTPPKQEPKK